MGRFPTLGEYTVLELEPIAGERRFQFRGPGLDPEHLGVIMTDADEALLVVSLLERAFAAGLATEVRTIDLATPPPKPEDEKTEVEITWLCENPFTYGGDDGP